MKVADIPELVQLPWADGAGPSFINSIPTPSQIGITTGLASLTDGFPPVTFLDEGAGGQPPFGADFNGILNLISANTRWNDAGGQYFYDSAFSTYIGGYPKGSVLESADFTGQWLSLVDDNTTNPDTGGAGWISLNSYGLYSLTSTGGTVTLTAAQYAKRIIIISGTLTSNLSIVFPKLIGQWLVVNNAVLGAFAVTATTSGGTSIPIIAGPTPIYGDGNNVKAVGALSPFSPQTVKAWAVFNAAGTIIASYNVASITKHSTGNFTLNFAKNLADANYTIQGSCGTANGVTGIVGDSNILSGGVGGTVGVKTVSACNVFTAGSGGGLSDTGSASVTIVGN